MADSIRLLALAGASLLALALPAHAQSDAETIGQMRERIGRLELEQARLQQENQTMQMQLMVLETRKKLKVAQQDEGVGVLPLIVAVSRVDESWSARLQGADGVVSTFVVGDIPQKGVRIVEIGPSGVKVEVGAGKGAQKLSRAYTGPVQQGGPAAGMTPGAAMPLPLPASLSAGARVAPSQTPAR